MTPPLFFVQDPMFRWTLWGVQVPSGIKLTVFDNRHSTTWVFYLNLFVDWKRAYPRYRSKRCPPPSQHKQVAPIMALSFFVQDPTFRWTLWGVQPSPRESLRVYVFDNRTLVEDLFFVNQIGWDRAWAGIDPTSRILHVLLHINGTYKHFASERDFRSPGGFSWRIRNFPVGSLDPSVIVGVSGFEDELRVCTPRTLWSSPMDTTMWGPLGFGGVYYGWEGRIKEKGSFDHLCCSMPSGSNGLCLAGQTGKLVRVFAERRDMTRCRLEDRSSHSPFDLVSVHPYGLGVLLKGESLYAVKFPNQPLIDFGSEIRPSWTRLGGLLWLLGRTGGWIRPPCEGMTAIRGLPGGESPPNVAHLWEDQGGIVHAVTSSGQLISNL